MRKARKMFGQYVLMACKVNGSKYLIDLINNMFKSFVRNIDN